ncbi:dienelactone hydrolase family protein [Massilia sp. CF038]|uniref:dienelactone hydrolase family protein n=1 Tax=Massilia sp. CF038 TaxID=1881045 RepID=UPI0009201BFB|nr:dienelactone hydrolase family protein [Massilia sp. CF038]SHG69775.1 carboxymethylenebutenolidase [Massilia sp. CF038]
MSDRITITVPDGAFEAYIARPDAAQAPCVVVIQEIFGINADMRAHCDALAAKGYIALCPDLFWRLEPGVELTDQSEAEWARAMALYKKFNVDKGVDDVAATMAAARALPGATGKIGVMGYCAGGLLTFLTAARHGADAAAAYYGGGTHKYLGEVAQLNTPLIMHLGEADEYIDQQARSQIENAVQAKYNIKVYTYPGQNHAFARVNGKHFDAAAARLANERTYALFEHYLISPTA